MGAADDVTWHVAGSTAEVLDLTRDCAAVGVDIPMGLPAREYRRCDLDAQRRLGHARASVFHAPVRSVLAATDYDQARAASLAARRKSLSRQTWSLVDKIREWDRDGLPPDVVEVHPEVSLRAMAPGTRFAGKKSARGTVQRLAVLAGWLDTRRLLADPLPEPGLDDMLDALACAWTARRWAARNAKVLGDEVDDTGRAMRIVV